MTNRHSFGQLCAQVCAQQGWEILPGGVGVTLPSGRRQVVTLEFFEDQEELVRLATGIGSAQGMPSERLSLALQINARLAHGALAVRDGELVMIDTLMLQDADAAEIEASIRYLADTADYYEKTIFGTDQY